MHVRVVFHRSAERSLREWRMRLSHPPGGDTALALFMREELIRKLEQSEGFPEGAEYQTNLIPPGWVRKFAEGAMIHFAVRDHSGILGFGRARDVVIFRVTPENPG